MINVIMESQNNQPLILSILLGLVNGRRKGPDPELRSIVVLKT